MIPALGAGHGVHEARWRRARRFYGAFVVRLVRWRWATISLTIAVLGVLTWAFVKRVPRISFGNYGDQRTTLNASINFPRGSDPETLDRSMRELESIVLGYSEVERVMTQGNSYFGAVMQVLFTRDGGVTGRPIELEEKLIQRAALIGGANVSVRGQGPGFAAGGISASASTFRVRLLGYSFAGV
jgi:multidrug efflux pump subunit AcrB